MTILKVAAASMAVLGAYSFIRLRRVVNRGPLSYTRVDPPSNVVHRTTIVLVHGMWHGDWYWKEMQHRLAARGYASIALQLRAGPCVGINQHMMDIGETLKDIKSPVVLVGHSQGGLLVQSVFRDVLSKYPQIDVAGMVICGSVPLSMPMKKLMDTVVRVRTKEVFWKEARESKTLFSELGFLGNLYYMFFGQLWSEQCTKGIFMLPSTKDTTLCKGGLVEYVSKIMQTPADGWPTYQHYLQPEPTFDPRIFQVPILVCGADQDVIYPPVNMNIVFKVRYPHCQTMVVRDQAHCFADPGWEESFVEPVVDWIDSQDGFM